MNKTWEIKQHTRYGDNYVLDVYKVTNGDMVFECEYKDDADWLVEKLNGHE